MLEDSKERVVLNIWNVNSWCHLAVVCIRHAREQVVLDLVVDASEDKSIYGADGLEIRAVLDLELQPVVAFVMVLS